MLRIEKSFYVSDNLFLGRSYIFFFYFCLYSSLDHYLYGPLELNSTRPSFLLIPFILTIILFQIFPTFLASWFMESLMHFYLFFISVFCLFTFTSNLFRVYPPSCLSSTL